MCKTPGCKCQTVESGHHIIMEENHVASEDEGDSDDSYCPVTSSDEEGSASDAESASGHRLTTDMVVSFMLKEQGFISEERYAATAEKCDEDIRFLIPKVPKSRSSDCASSSDESDDRDMSLDDLVDVMLARQDLKKKLAVTTNESVVETHKNEATANGTLKDVTVEKEAFVKDHDVCDVLKNDKNMSPEHTNQELQLEHTVPDLNKKDCDAEVIEKLQGQPTLIGSNEKEAKKQEKEQAENVTSDSAMGDAVKNNDFSNENNPKLGTSNNDIQDKSNKGLKVSKLFGTDEESENEDLKTEDYTNEATDKITKSFKDILKILVKEKRISEDYEYVDVLESYVKELDECYKNNEAVNKFNKRTKELKEFALFLNFYSPSSYKYITDTFNTALPGRRALCTWYLKDDYRPGLSKRAFAILKQKASKKRLTCALMSRDIFLTNYGLNYDQVDYGGGCNWEYTDKAVMAYVFLLVSLDEDWKIPIGYIFARRIPAETQAELIRVCLTQCHDAGADVVAVTLDTPTPAEFLGCSFGDPKNLKTTFKHPECDRDVAVWIDPCLALRSARHTLKVKGVLIDDAGSKVRWNLIRKLRNLHSDETMDFENPRSLKLRNHIAKVGLTTEIFSESLSPALKLCEDLLPDLFRDTASTRRYIEIINTLYNVLNTRTTTKLSEVEDQLNSAKEYLIALFCHGENKLSPFDKENLAPDKRLEYRSFVEGRPACGFIGFLICIESFKHLHATLVEKEQRLNLLNPHRLCKDHVENFVNNIRAYNPRINPNDFGGFQFQMFYDHLLDILERDPLFTDQKVSIEQWPLRNKYPPVETIKLTSGKRAYDEAYSFQYFPKKLPKTSHEDRATKLVRDYSKAMDTEMDVSTRKNMVGYLAGWIAARFARHLKCEACIDELCSDKKLLFHKFITLRHLRGVCLPSEELFRICWETERALRPRGAARVLRARALRRLASAGPARAPASTSPAPASSGPAHHHASHHGLLVRAVVSKYLPLRVAAPFSAKETKRIVDMYRLFTCMIRSGLFDELEAGAERDGDV